MATYQDLQEGEGTSGRNEYREIVTGMFSVAGITVNGSQAHDIQVNNENFFRRFLSDGSLGLGESYMDGWWECEGIDEMMTRLIGANLHEVYRKNLQFIYSFLRAKFLNLGKKSKAFEVGKKHYDLGNDLFVRMLDRRMIYSSAYWRDAETIDQAQENKLDLICRKIDLKPDMRVLDIGCGWGGFAKFAAEKYGVRVVGITVSSEQAKLAQDVCRGLPVAIKLMDYRDLDDEFDRIVSVGMFEHVWHKSHRTYMKVVHRCMKDDGLFLLQTVGRNETLSRPDPFIAKYIFPNSLSPSLRRISDAIEGLFVIEDLHNFGVSYDKTLMAWHERFVRSWSEIKQNYDERFFRMWTMFLLSCAGAFRSRYLQLWQVVLSKRGVPGGYLNRLT